MLFKNLKKILINKKQMKNFDKKFNFKIFFNQTYIKIK